MQWVLKGSRLPNIERHIIYMSCSTMYGTLNAVQGRMKTLHNIIIGKQINDVKIQDI